MFLKLTHIPSHFKCVSSNAAFFHKKHSLKQTVAVKTCFPTALQQLNGMQRKNAFPSHGSLPLQSLYLPPPVRKEKKKSRDFILKNRRFAHSFTWDSSWTAEAS